MTLKDLEKRREVKKRGKEAHARDFFDRTVMTYEQYKIFEQVYHGGYTHANRQNKKVNGSEVVQEVVEQIKEAGLTIYYLI